MKTKICTKCKIEKPINEFSKNKTQNDGYFSWCKNCHSEYYKIHYIENRDKEIEKSHKYYLKNKDKRKKYNKINRIKNKKYGKQYYLKNKIHLNENCQKYWIKNKERMNEKQHEYYLKNKDKIIEKAHNYYLKNKDILNEKKREYQRKNKDKLNKKKAIYKRKRIHNNINYRILCNLRGRLYKALKFNYKSKHTLELLGCSVEFLKQYLSSKFILGMSWENYGGGWNGKGMQEWHIDHIKPCVSFDLSNPEEQKKCFHYTNLQPLWAEENIIKGKNEN